MGLLKNKRGISIDKLFLIELFLAIIVSAGMLYYVYSISNDNMFEKKVITRDLSMLSNSIQSVPGNVYYEYTPSKKKLYNIELADNMIIISEESYSKLGYPYFNNLFLTQGLYSLPNANKISLSNFNNAFVVASQPMAGLKHEIDIPETLSTGYKIVPEHAKQPSQPESTTSSQTSVKESNILNELEKEQMTEQITD